MLATSGPYSDVYSLLDNMKEQLVAEAADQQQAEASSGAGVWTPEAGENPAASSSTQAPPEEPKQESKLWVPGMDGPPVLFLLGSSVTQEAS